MTSAMLKHIDASKVGAEHDGQVLLKVASNLDSQQ
jgi:hypothetical protein